VDDWFARDTVAPDDFAPPAVTEEADEPTIEPLTFLIPETKTVAECIAVMRAARWLAPDTVVEDARETAMVPVIAFAPDAEVLDAADAVMLDCAGLVPEAEVLDAWLA
jgi:hypothetical protein